MGELSREDVTNIENLHDLWIAKELIENVTEILDLCTNDVQLRPPDSRPIVGKPEIAKYLGNDKQKVLTIEITDRCIRGSGSVAYLTSNYSSRYFDEAHPDIVQEANGSHLWILRKENGYWRVAIVTWSSW